MAASLHEAWGEILLQTPSASTAPDLGKTWLHTKSGNNIGTWDSLLRHTLAVDRFCRSLRNVIDLVIAISVRLTIADEARLMSEISSSTVLSDIAIVNTIQISAFRRFWGQRLGGNALDVYAFSMLDAYDAHLAFTYLMNVDLDSATSSTDLFFDPHGMPAFNLEGPLRIFNVKRIPMDVFSPEQSLALNRLVSVSTAENFNDYQPSIPIKTSPSEKPANMLVQWIARLRDYTEPAGTADQEIAGEYPLLLLSGRNFALFLAAMRNELFGDRPRFKWIATPRWALNVDVFRAVMHLMGISLRTWRDALDLALNVGPQIPRLLPIAGSALHENRTQKQTTLLEAAADSQMFDVSDNEHEVSFLPSDIMYTSRAARLHKANFKPVPLESALHYLDMLLKKGAGFRSPWQDRAYGTLLCGDPFQAQLLKYDVTELLLFVALTAGADGTFAVAGRMIGFNTLFRVKYEHSTRKSALLSQYIATTARNKSYEIAVEWIRLYMLQQRIYWEYYLLFKSIKDLFPNKKADSKDTINLFHEIRAGKENIKGIDIVDPVGALNFAEITRELHAAALSALDGAFAGNLEDVMFELTQKMANNGVLGESSRRIALFDLHFAARYKGPPRSLLFRMINDARHMLARLIMCMLPGSAGLRDTWPAGQEARDSGYSLSTPVENKGEEMFVYIEGNTMRLVRIPSGTLKTGLKRFEVSEHDKEQYVWIM